MQISSYSIEDSRFPALACHDTLLDCSQEGIGSSALFGRFRLN